MIGRAVSVPNLAESSELVLVEPGAQTKAGLRGSSEQNHLLVWCRNESLLGFQSRVRERVRSMARSEQRLAQVTYLVGDCTKTDWAERQALLAELSHDLPADGVVVVHAPSNASGNVLACLGELQLSTPSGLRLRAVFSDNCEAQLPQTQLPVERTDCAEERSGVRFARPHETDICWEAGA